MPVLFSSTFSSEVAAKQRMVSLELYDPSCCRGRVWGQEHISPLCRSLGEGSSILYKCPGHNPMARLTVVEDATPTTPHIIPDRSSTDRWEKQPAEHHSRAFNHSFVRESSVLPMLAGMDSCPQAIWFTAGHAEGGRDSRTPPTEPLWAEPAAGPWPGRGHQLQSRLCRAGAGRTAALFVPTPKINRKGLFPESTGRKVFECWA